MRERRHHRLSVRAPWRRLAACLLAATGAAPAGATDYLWKDQVAGTWENAANWTPIGVPGIGDSAEIRSGAVTITHEQWVTGFVMSYGAIADGTFNVLGHARLTGGQHNGTGTSRFLGTVDLAGDDWTVLQDQRVLEVGPTALLRWRDNTVVDGGILYLNGNGPVLNRGFWSDENVFSTKVLGQFANRFVNEGTYQKIGPGVTTIAAIFDNTGTTRVLSGELALFYNGMGSGTFDVAAPGTLTFGSSGYTITPTAKLQGDGRLLFSVGTTQVQGVHVHAGTLAFERGTLQIDQSLTTNRIEQADGAVGGNGSLTVTGEALWRGGVHTDSGLSLYQGTLSIADDERKTVQFTRVLRVAPGATATWAGNGVVDGNAIAIDSGAKLVNDGLWRDANAFATALQTTSFAGQGRFVNAGRYEKLGAATTSVGVTFENTGELAIQDGRLLQLAAFDNRGTIEIAAGAMLQVDDAAFANHGRLAGNGSIRTAAGGALANAGTIAPGFSTGLLTIDGDLRLDHGGHVEIELASLADFDRLVISDDLAFGGIVDVIASGYAPVVGDSFVIASFDQRLGTSSFERLSWTGFGAGVAFELGASAHQLVLTVVAVPEPGTWVLWLAGLALGLHRWAARRGGTAPGEAADKL